MIVSFKLDNWKPISPALNEQWLIKIIFEKSNCDVDVIQDDKLTCIIVL